MEPEATSPSEELLAESDSTPQIPETIPESAEPESKEDNGEAVVEELKEDTDVEDEKVTEPETQEPIVESQEDAPSPAEIEGVVETTVSQNIQ